MGKITLIFRILQLDKGAIEKLSAPETHFRGYSSVISVLLGLLYGFTAININLEFIRTFETPILRQVFIPAVFLFSGYIMMLLTKVGLTLLLWAGSRGLGGGGFLAILYQITTIALIPSIIALPAFISLQAGTPLSMLMLVSIGVALIWIYFVCAKIVEVVQHFVPWKAYVAVLLAFIFFMSIYYIILPPPT
ncbi:YIP1 family protein [Desulfosporosinus sp. BICA1-9]|uniref:YIP1 family protein n=1 Tax=Desulfosporosinus sp. BICA1-9 TaxID=1531958 RepID=UPI00054C38AD|nr:YIP1 family protein [Desulfosporosinus sp. BICA1-9]KJS49262.1 MAG: hypothetical protein VR66_09505 [Peptococcaceae bacterium BRH_c23]KJS89819.1 MAG: hypothetical protein JL57_05130 [Desulfosporosinus sp. BICA1-9]HBW34620.1 hypothetical protein [Desulfosporosinus sp.]